MDKDGGFPTMIAYWENDLAEAEMIITDLKADLARAQQKHETLRICLADVKRYLRKIADDNLQ